MSVKYSQRKRKMRTKETGLQKETSDPADEHALQTVCDKQFEVVR